MSFVRRRRMENPVHFANLMDLCHLKKAKLAKPLAETQGASCAPLGQHQKRRRTQSSIHGARCFRVPGDSGLLETISKLHAVTAYTPGKMTEAPRLLRLPQEEKREICISIPPRQRPKSWNNIDDLVVPLARNLYCHPLDGLLWERHFEDVLFEKGGKITSMGMSLRVQKARNILIGPCGRKKKVVGKKQNMGPVWTILQKEVDLEDPAIDRSSVFTLHAKRSKGLIPKRSNPKPSCSKKLRTTSETDEQDETKENIRWKTSLLGAMIWKVMPKMRWEILRISEEKCVFSSAGGSTVHRRSPDTSGRLGNNRRILCDMCSNCPAMPVLDKNWLEDQIYYGQ